MFDDLTARQYEVYRFVRRFILDHDRPPTIRQIGEAFGIGSPNGVMCHLQALQRKWYLRRVADEGQGLYVPVTPEVVVEPVTGGQVRLATTGPVLMTADGYARWLAQQLAALGL
jgi:repressor LexA